MSENEQEQGSQDTQGGDEKSEQDDPFTPEDLQPGEDNPLAEPLDDDEARDDLDVMGGKMPVESDDEEQSSEED